MIPARAIAREPWLLDESPRQQEYPPDVRGGARRLALLATACSDDGDDDDVQTEATTVATTEDPVTVAEARVDEAEDGVTEAQTALEDTREQFCVDAEDYIAALDRYGKLFTDADATVGDVNTAGADLVAPRETVSASARRAVSAAQTDLASAEQELAEAQAALAGDDCHRIERCDERDVTAVDDHHDDRPGGHHHPCPAGRGRPRGDRRGHQ